MNVTTYRRAPAPVPDLPHDGLRPVGDEDDPGLAALVDRAWGDGAGTISGWRLFGVPHGSFVVATDRILAASLVSCHAGKFWITYVITDPEHQDLAAPPVAASLRALDAPVLAGLTELDESTRQLLTGFGFTGGRLDLPVLVVDGAAFPDLAGFAREFTKLLDDYTWTGNLDAFNDILRGGFGTPDLGWTFRWLNAERSRSALGHEAMAEWLERILRTCHPGNREDVAARLAGARRGEGQTLFDLIVEIIRDHGPGGDQSRSNVILELR